MPGTTRSERRWAVADSNCRPPVCKTGALTAELTARGPSALEKITSLSRHSAPPLCGRFLRGYREGYSVLIHGDHREQARGTELPGVLDRILAKDVDPNLETGPAN